MRRAAALALVLAGCVEPLGQDRAAIIGGEVSFADPAVVALRTCRSELGGGCGICTGTLVTPQVVLTAGHCVDDNLEAGEVDMLEVFFGTNVEGEGTTVAVDAALLHRYYDRDTLDFDLAVVHLAEPAPADVEPVTLSTEPLGEADVGTPVRMVGYGETSFDAGDFGVRRTVDGAITIVAPAHIFTGTAQENTCKGDSGGPIFADLGAGEVQIGVTSRSIQCQANSVKMRIDPFVHELVWRFSDARDGACAADGSCTEDCPRWPDPDCDPCGLDGTCAEGCPAADWDCPVAGLVGDRCEDAGECEFRVCQEALDDPRVRYCSRACEPGDATACLGGMECRDGRCVWPAPTPGALGSICTLPEDCRSGLCEDSVCVEPCDEVAGGTCPAPYECRPSAIADVEVCGPVLADDAGGCGCRAGGGSGAALPVSLLALVWALARRRRPR